MNGNKFILQEYKDNKYEDLIQMIRGKTNLNLKLIGYAECESKSAKSFEISDSLKVTISNIQDTYIVTNQPRFNQSYILNKMLLNDHNNLYQNCIPDKYDYSRIDYIVFNPEYDDEIRQLLNNHMDYIFVFSKD